MVKHARARHRHGLAFITVKHASSLRSTESVMMHRAVPAAAAREAGRAPAAEKLTAMCCDRTSPSAPVTLPESVVGPPRGRKCSSRALGRRVTNSTAPAKAGAAVQVAAVAVLGRDRAAIAPIVATTTEAIEHHETTTSATVLLPAKVAVAAARVAQPVAAMSGANAPRAAVARVVDPVVATAAKDAQVEVDLVVATAAGGALVAAVVPVAVAIARAAHAAAVPVTAAISIAEMIA